jgi:ArsR family transcriptional regulator, arsenate/arsenite/antimonite-responsive transcriptional repressor
MSKQAAPEVTLVGSCCTPLSQASINAQAAQAFAPAFKAIGDPVRLQLLSMIASHADGEVCVCELTPEFPLSGPTISHHLKVLREAGLIDCERRGTWVYYWANSEKLRGLSALLGTAAPVPV